MSRARAPRRWIRRSDSISCLRRWRDTLSKPFLLFGRSRAGRARAASDRRVRRRPAGAPTARAEIERLFRHTGITTLAGVVVALCTWLLFHRHRPSMPVLAWALLIHGAQAATLGVLLAFRRDTDALTGPSTWRQRHRIALALTAVGWGIAPVFLLGPDDLAYAALVVLVLLGMAVVGAIAAATDRTSIYPVAAAHRDAAAAGAALARRRCLRRAGAGRRHLDGRSPAPGAGAEPPAQQHLAGAARERRPGRAAAPADGADRPGQPGEEPVPRLGEPRPAPAAACAELLRRDARAAHGRVGRPAADLQHDAIDRGARQIVRRDPRHLQARRRRGRAARPVVPDPRPVPAPADELRRPGRGGRAAAPLSRPAPRS